MLAVGDTVIEQDQIDSILDGFPEEYNPFVMKIYGTMESFSLYDVKELLYVQEVQLDKFRQELVVANVSTNVAQANHQTCGVCDQHTNSPGRIRVSHGRGLGRGHTVPGTRPTCQLCGKYGHVIVDCWHRFDETYTFTPAQTNDIESTTASIDKHVEVSTYPQAMALMAHAHEYSLPTDLKSRACFPNTGASHHLTFNPCFLHSKKVYNGMSHVNVANGQSLPITCVGSANVSSLSCLSFGTILNDIILVPCVTRNLLSYSEFSKDNKVVFEFYANKCLVKY